MSAVHLARIDPARNVRRFYRLDVQPDLFGGFAVVKEWGRIHRVMFHADATSPRPSARAGA
jgi:predicted DNA-binding WGR domain protein